MAIGARSIVDRITDKFLVGDGCWQWTASLHKGYGQINSGYGRPLAAHRVVYELVTGPIPEGLQLDHLCRNRACVRPDHLEPVTQAENKRRGEAGLVHKRRMEALTHCLRGHEFTSTNTRVGGTSDRPVRTCRACKALRERERRMRKRAGS
jgi:hypothetical protein